MSSNHLVLFTEQLPAEKQAEGLAIHWAVRSGKCNQCDCLQRCCSDSSFKMPEDSFCMKKKSEILKEWRAEDGNNS